jgi:hypothetical protein
VDFISEIMKCARHLRPVKPGITVFFRDHVDFIFGGIDPKTKEFRDVYVMSGTCATREGHRAAKLVTCFTGTGSILLAAAASGAHCLGADIDIRVIRDGKPDKSGNPCNVYTNFWDYSLTEPLGLLRMDAGNPAWRRSLHGVFDAILCDPPYGVRAGGRTMLPKPDAASAANIQKCVELALSNHLMLVP